MIRWVYEDDDLAMIREAVKRLSLKQLTILEEIIKREKVTRHKKVFSQWVEELKNHIEESEKISDIN